MVEGRDRVTLVDVGEAAATAVWLVLTPGLSLANPERQTRQAAQRHPGIQPRGGRRCGRERPDVPVSKAYLR